MAGSGGWSDEDTEAFLRDMDRELEQAAKADRERQQASAGSGARAEEQWQDVARLIDKLNLPKEEFNGLLMWASAPPEALPRDAVEDHPYLRWIARHGAPGERRVLDFAKLYHELKRRAGEAEEGGVEG